MLTSARRPRETAAHQIEPAYALHRSHAKQAWTPIPTPAAASATSASALRTTTSVTASGAPRGRRS